MARLPSSEGKDKPPATATATASATATPKTQPEEAPPSQPTDAEGKHQQQQQQQQQRSSPPSAAAAEAGAGSKEEDQQKEEPTAKAAPAVDIELLPPPTAMPKVEPTRGNATLPNVLRHAPEQPDTVATQEPSPEDCVDMPTPVSADIEDVRKTFDPKQDSEIEVPAVLNLLPTALLAPTEEDDNESAASTVDFSALVSTKQVDHLTFAPMAEILPLCKSFVDRGPGALLAECDSAPDLVKFSQALVRKLMREYRFIRKASDDLRKSFEKVKNSASASAEGAAAKSQTGLLEVGPPSSEKEGVQSSKEGSKQESDHPQDEMVSTETGKPKKGEEEFEADKETDKLGDAATKTEETEKGESMQQLQSAELGNQQKAKQGSTSTSQLVTSEQLALDRATRRLQATWRRHHSKVKLLQYLKALALEDLPRPRADRGPGNNSTNSSWGSLGSRLKSVLGTFSLLSRIHRQLRRRGLDFCCAFACASHRSADQSADENFVGPVLSVGQFLRYLAGTQHIAMLPAEAKVLLRLMMMPNRENRLESAKEEPLKGSCCRAVPASKDGHSEVAPAWQEGLSATLKEGCWWEMSELWSTLLADVCSSLPRLGGCGPAEGGPTATCKEVLREIQTIVKARTEPVDFAWGRVRGSWRRYLLEAYFVYGLQEELRTAKTTAPALGALQESGQERRAAGKEELWLNQRLAALRSSANFHSGGVPLELFVARLLHEPWEVAPIEVYAAAVAASEVCKEVRKGEVKAKISQSTSTNTSIVRTTSMLRASSRSLQTFAPFDRPLPLAPALIHFWSTPETGLWTLSMEQWTEQSAVLRVSLREQAGKGWTEELCLAYSAGSFSSSLLVGPSRERERLVTLHFSPRLPTAIVAQGTLQVETQLCKGRSASKAVVQWSAVRCSTTGFVISPAPGVSRDGPSPPQLRVFYEASTLGRVVTEEALSRLAPWPSSSSQQEEIEEDKMLLAKTIPLIPPPRPEDLEASDDGEDDEDGLVQAAEEKVNKQPARPQQQVVVQPKTPSPSPHAERDASAATSLRQASTASPSASAREPPAQPATTRSSRASSALPSKESAASRLPKSAAPVPSEAPSESTKRQSKEKKDKKRDKEGEAQPLLAPTPKVPQLPIGSKDRQRDPPPPPPKTSVPKNSLEARQAKDRPRQGSWPAATPPPED